MSQEKNENIRLLEGNSSPIDIRHQAKLKAVHNRMLEACDDYKTYLAERIYFSKKRSYYYVAGFIPDGKDDPKFSPHPNMKKLKSNLDIKMNEILDINNLQLGHFTSEGGDLIKKYWLVCDLSQSLLEYQNPTEQELLDFQEEVNNNREALLKNTGNAGLGFFKLNKQTGDAYFAFFETIGRLVKSIFNKTHSQRFVDGMTNVSLENPEGKDFRYSCVSNKNDGSFKTTYKMGKIY